MLTGIGGEAWAEAARAAEKHTGVGIDVHPIGTRDGILDAYGHWERLRGVDPSGCVLVRPDRHVAWRAQHAQPDATRQLHDVMQRVLNAPSAG